MAMYDLDQLKELINTIDQTGVTCFEIKGADGERLTIKKETIPAPQSHPVQNTAVQAAPAASAAELPVQPALAQKAETDNTTAITSPMVGVFYAASSPEAEPYAGIGTVIKKGDVICIIEAMKLMNEITATQSGVIEEVCVHNGDIVEFGQPLFKIK